MRLARLVISNAGMMPILLGVLIVGVAQSMSDRDPALSGAVQLLAVLSDASPTPAATPSITLSVTSGKPGTSITISGSGFPVDEIVALYIDSPEPYIGSSPPGPRADAQGKLRDSFLWPDNKYDPSHRIDPSKAGTHLVCGDTGYPGNDQAIHVKACAQFNEIPLPSPTPSAGNQPSAAISMPELAVALAILVAVVVGTVIWWRRSP